jgi:hypothetical protein
MMKPLLVGGKLNLALRRNMKMLKKGKIISIKQELNPKIHRSTLP